MQIVEISEPGEVIVKNEVVVGIDFGTTNSLIAISKDSKAEIIKMSDGAELVPSIVSVDKDKILVGKQAENTIRSVKRLLAKSSEEVKNNPNLCSLSDHLVFDGSLPKLLVNGREYTLPEIAAEIFKYLKCQAEKALKLKIERAVVSIPAYFDDSARGQVLLAAKIVGIDVIRLIAEPTAAAYAYGLNLLVKGSYLVYDLGGGTFDVSILNMQTGVLQVVATGGDNLLGGDDIDMLLANYIADSLNKEVDTEIIDYAKSCKEKLSDDKESRIIIGNSSFMISRSKYEEIILPLINKTIKISKEVLHDAESLELSGIILVGGSTRIPLIRTKLKEAFNLPIYADLDPDKVVAFGTALQAENLSVKTNSLLIDVVPLSVGLELYGGIAEKIIVRNTPIPFSINREFTTHADNQTGMKFHILQGEREMVKDCRSLAHFELRGIPPMKAGKARVKVNFVMDADGILSVTAQEAKTGKVQDIEIKPSFGLSEEEVNQALSVAYANAAKDHKERKLAETRSSASSLIEGLHKALLETPDIMSRDEVVEIEEAINSLQKVINADNRDNILLKIDNLNKLASKFIQKHLDQGVDLHLKGHHIDEV